MLLLRHSGVIAGTAFALCAAAAVAQPVPGHDRHVERQERTVIIRRGDDMGSHRADHLRAILQLKPGQENALAA